MCFRLFLKFLKYFLFLWLFISEVWKCVVDLDDDVRNLKWLWFEFDCLVVDKVRFFWDDILWCKDFVNDCILVWDGRVVLSNLFLFNGWSMFKDVIGFGCSLLVIYIYLCNSFFNGICYNVSVIGSMCNILIKVDIFFKIFVLLFLLFFYFDVDDMEVDVIERWEKKVWEWECEWDCEWDKEWDNWECERECEWVCDREWERDWLECDRERDWDCDCDCDKNWEFWECEWDCDDRLIKLKKFVDFLIKCERFFVRFLLLLLLILLFEVEEVIEKLCKK